MNECIKRSLYYDEDDIVYCQCSRKCGTLDRSFGDEPRVCLTNVRECVQCMVHTSTHCDNPGLIVMTAEVLEITRENATQSSRIIDNIDLTNDEKTEVVDLTNNRGRESVIKTNLAVGTEVAIKCEIAPTPTCGVKKEKPADADFSEHNRAAESTSDMQPPSVSITCTPTLDGFIGDGPIDFAFDLDKWFERVPDFIYNSWDDFNL